jgi:DNA-binding MarR family transcriptional regulator
MDRLASELEDAGYVRVQSDPKDARVRILQLSETGRRLMLDSLEVWQSWSAAMYVRSGGID